MKPLYFMCLLAFPALALADDAAPTLEQRVPKEVVARDDAYFTLTVENDLFGLNGTDENYTSGVRLSYFNDQLVPPTFITRLGEALPLFKTSEQTQIYYSLGQNLYTPQDITARVPNPNDRPYAGFLYGSVGYTTIVDNHLDDMEVTIGVVGPAALGEQTQDFVHDIISADDPQGWGAQLHNEPALMLAYQRSWPEAVAFEAGPLYFRAAPHAGLTLGNVYTYAATGLTLQLVPTRQPWQLPPPRVRPSIPGRGFTPCRRGNLPGHFLRVLKAAPLRATFS